MYVLLVYVAMDVITDLLLTFVIINIKQNMDVQMEQTQEMMYMFTIDDNIVPEVALRVTEQSLAGQHGNLLIPVQLQKNVNGATQTVFQHVYAHQDHAVMAVSTDQVHTFVIMLITHSIDAKEQTVEMM